jgi:hypothetical protein
MNLQNTKITNEGYCKGKLEKFQQKFICRSNEGEVIISPNPLTELYLNVNDIDPQKQLCFKGFFKTTRLPSTTILYNAKIIPSEQYKEVSTITGMVFGIYKNCIDTYGEKYNYILLKDSKGINVKLSFKKLPDYQIKDRLIKGDVIFQDNRLILKDFELLPDFFSDYENFK